MRRQGSRRSARRSDAPAAEPLTLAVARLGAGGDGIATLPDGRAAYIAGALPGETVEAAPGAKRGEGVAARLVSVLSPSPERIAPPCQHAALCGGCSVQHMGEALYATWKAGLAAAALSRAGFPAVAMAPLARSAPGTRRRADLAIRLEGRHAIVGFHARGSGAVADIPGCLVLHPALREAAAALRAAAPRFAALLRDASAVMTLAREGVDLWLVSARVPDGPTRAALAAFAREARLARLNWSQPGHEAEPVAVLAPPTVRFGAASVPLPAGAFLQATEEGEAAIVSAVLAALADLPANARVADLYAGCGTLTFPLAERFRVLAAEGEAASVAALKKGIGSAGLSGRIVAEARDLTTRPLSAAEQKGLAAVVLDPPRDGAAAQVAALASGPTRRIVYVSCNPNALARDARILHEAGFRLDGAVPIDQFLWSPHLECVASFSR
ncbi:class I SAM-dependent RNA methyltransferase [Elioraea rosea]|uniref:class I SAM-dependent RNA methyltransferase n=1 Tax=Elioraea rosea TaxID=2492390 RepID=UPI001EF6284C|nr:class I SAM-dependent RNA methyltransferase [Elioraea rosea]